MLSTGHGSIDWAGLPTVAALLGIDDLEVFIRRLMVIKHHTPGAGNEPAPTKEQQDVTGNIER